MSREKYHALKELIHYINHTWLESENNVLTSITKIYQFKAIFILIYCYLINSIGTHCSSITINNYIPVLIFQTSTYIIFCKGLYESKL